MEQAAARAALPPQHKAEASDPTPRPSPASADENNKPCLLLHLDASKTLVRAMQPEKPFVVVRRKPPRAAAPLLLVGDLGSENRFCTQGRAANADAQLLVPHISCAAILSHSASCQLFRLLRFVPAVPTWQGVSLHHVPSSRCVVHEVAPTRYV